MTGYGIEHGERPSGRRFSRRAVLGGAVTGVSAVALSAALVACGASSSPNASNAAVKLIATGDNAAQGRLSGYVAAFEKSANVPVTLVGIENYYTSNIQAMVAAGVPPDVVYVTRSEFDILLAAKKLADLQPYRQKDANSGDFYPIALQEWRAGDQQLALPLGFRTLGVAFNENLLTQVSLPFPPFSWSATGWGITDFADTAMKAAQPGSTSQDAEYGFYVDPTYLVWATFVLNNGGSVVDEQNRRILVDQPPAIEALAVLQTVLLKPGVQPPNDLIAADGGIDLFANGSLALAIIDPSGIGGRQRQAHFVWDTGVLPGDAGGRVTLGTGAGYTLLAGSKRPEDGWKLIQYLTSAAVQQQEAPVGAWIPSRPAVAISPAFLPELDNVDLYPQHAKVFVDALTENRVQLQPALSNWSAVQSALEAGAAGLWTGQLTPAAAAAQMKKLAEPLLQS